MQSRRTVRILTLTLAAAAACGGGDKQASNPSGDSSGVAAVAKAPQAFAECTIDHASTACDNVLPSNWQTLTDAALYDRLANDIEWRRSTRVPSKRKHRDAGCSKRPAKQFMRAPSRALNVSRNPASKWEPGTAVAMAQILTDGDGQCTDGIYGVGSETPNSRYFVVFTVAAQYTLNSKGDTIVGRWTVFRFDSLAPEHPKTPVSTGSFVRCAVQHGSRSAGAESHFENCEKKHMLLQIAKDNSMDVEEAFVQFDSLRNEKAFGKTLNMTGANSALIAMEKLLQSGAPDTDPVWITCSLSCCTAEDPHLLSLTGAAKRAAWLPKRTTRSRPRVTARGGLVSEVRNAATDDGTR